MFPYGTNVFKVCENEMLSKMIKYGVEEKEEINMPIIESNRTDNDLFEMIRHSIEKMNTSIIENDRTDSDLFAKYNDDDLDSDLDDELKELTERHLDIDPEDEMIEEKIDDGEIKDVIDRIDGVADDKIEYMMEEKQEDKIEDNKERTICLDKINKQIDHVNLLARIRNDFSRFFMTHG